MGQTQRRLRSLALTTSLPIVHRQDAKNRQVRQEKISSKVDSISVLSAVANAPASVLSCSQLNCLSILGDLGGSWRLGGEFSKVERSKTEGAHPY